MSLLYLLTTEHGPVCCVESPRVDVDKNFLIFNRWMGDVYI